MGQCRRVRLHAISRSSSCLTGPASGRAPDVASRMTRSSSSPSASRPPGTRLGQRRGPIQEPTPEPDRATEPERTPATGPMSEPSPEPDAEPNPEVTPAPPPTPGPIPEAMEEPTPEATPGPTPENVAPEADAGGPYEVDEGDTVRLDGRGSSDADGNIVAYEWSREKRLDDPTKARPRFKAMDDGELDIELTVTDDRGASDTARATITVRNVDPRLAAINDRTGVVDEEVTLIDIAFTDPGADDTHTMTVDWGDGSDDTPAVDERVGMASAGHVYHQPGSYSVTVRIDDDDGGMDTLGVEIRVERPKEDAAKPAEEMGVSPLPSPSPPNASG